MIFPAYHYKIKIFIFILMMEMMFDLYFFLW